MGVESEVFAARKNKNAAPVVTETADTETRTQISLPEVKKNRTYFGEINETALADLENGSPESITQAVALVRKPDNAYTDVEKVFLTVATRMMKTAYASEKLAWDFSYPEVQSAYTGALDSVDKGIFDSSTGNTDFLTTLLPAFLLFKDSISDDSLTYCENALNAAENFKSDSFLLKYMKARLSYFKNNFSAAETYIADSTCSNMEFKLFQSQVLYKCGKVQLADLISQQLLVSYPTNLNVLKQACYINFELGNFEKTEEYVAKVLQQTPNNQEFLLFRAKILIAKKDYIHAVSMLDMYARSNNTNLDYLLLRSKVQLEWSKNTTQATETVEKALALYPDNQEALLFAARLASMVDGPVAGKYADELVANILTKDPGNKEAISYALTGLVQRENWQEAYKISSVLVTEEDGGPLSGDVVINHVEICLKLNKTAEALSFAAEQYKLNNTDETVLQAYVLAQVNGGSKNQSMQFINSLLDSSSAKMKSFLYYTRSFLQPNETAVLADLRSSLISNPRNSDTLFRMYEIYYDKTDYRKAQYYLKQVVALNPNDSSVKNLNENLTKLIK